MQQRVVTKLVGYDEKVLVKQVLDGFASLPLSTRQKVAAEVKKRAKLLPNLSASEVDEFLQSIEQIKTSPFGITKKKVGVLLTGLVAASFLYVCFQGWGASSVAASTAKAFVHAQYGEAYLYAPAMDVTTSKKELFSLQQQLFRKLPASLKTVKRNIEQWTTKVSENEQVVQRLESDIDAIRRFQSAGDPLPASIRTDLEKILIKTILKVDVESPLLLTGDQQQKKAQVSLFSGLSSMEVALTPRQTGAVKRWVTDFKASTPVMQASMYQLVIDRYLSEKEARYDGAVQALENARMQLERETQERQQTQRRIVSKQMQRPEKKTEIEERQARRQKYAKDFAAKIVSKEKQLRGQKLDGKPFTATEYFLMGESVLLCTVLMYSTGPFPVLSVFPSVFTEFLFQGATIIGLVVHTFQQGEAVTMGHLLMDTLGLTLKYGVLPWPSQTTDNQTSSNDQVLFMSVLVCVSLLLFGYNAIVWFGDTFGFTKRAYQTENERLKKEREADRKRIQQLQRRLVQR